MRFRRLILLFTIPAALFFISGCRQYYLSVSQEWVDVRYLASSHVHTPDPRLQKPPVGQMLILDWRVPSDVLKKKPVVVLDLIFWDYTTKQIRYPVERRMDFATFRLLDEEYEKSGGILTYKAEMITEDGQVYRKWKHQLWVELITVSD
jgi:hypothetical protein